MCFCVTISRNTIRPSAVAVYYYIRLTSGTKSILYTTGLCSRSCGLTKGLDSKIETKRTFPSSFPSSSWRETMRTKLGDVVLFYIIYKNWATKSLVFPYICVHLCKTLNFQPVISYGRSRPHEGPQLENWDKVHFSLFFPVKLLARDHVDKTRLFYMIYKNWDTKVALIYFHTLQKWSAILGLNFSVWCWLPRCAWPQ